MAELPSRFSRRDFLKAAGLMTGSALLAACAPRKYAMPIDEFLTGTPHTPTPDPKVTESPYSTPNKTPEPSPTLNVREPFVLGGIDFATTKFTIDEDPELRRFLGHIIGSYFTFYADAPFAITTQDGPANQEASSAFKKAGENRPIGNPYSVYLTDQPNHLVFYTHSEQITHATPGEFSREIVSWWFRHQDQENDLYQKRVILKINGASYSARIANANYISGSFWEGEENTSPWGNGGLYINKLGIPDAIRNDTSSNKMYLTFVGCINKNPGEISTDHGKLPGIPAMNKDEANYLNTYNRSILTLEVTLSS